MGFTTNDLPLLKLISRTVVPVIDVFVFFFFFLEIQK